jgi:hypothetical protein
MRRSRSIGGEVQHCGSPGKNLSPKVILCLAGEQTHLIGSIRSGSEGGYGTFIAIHIDMAKPWPP